MVCLLTTIMVSHHIRTYNVSVVKFTPSCQKIIFSLWFDTQWALLSVYVFSLSFGKCSTDFNIPSPIHILTF